MKDGKGSPIVVLPILILLLFAGLAAGAGIAIGADDAATPVAAPVIPNPDLGPSCAAVAGPQPTTVAEAQVWLRTVASCIENRIEGMSYDAQGNPQNSVAVSGLENYRGVAIEGFNGNVVVVRWKGAVPPIVLDRIGSLPPGTTVTFVPAAS